MSEIPPLELQPELPATPMSVLALSDVFDRYGYHKLARHLRAAADSMAAAGRTEVHAVLVAARYEEHVAGSRYGVTFKGSDAAVHDVRLGQRYALVPLPAEPAHSQPLLPLKSVDSSDLVFEGVDMNIDAYYPPGVH